MGDPLDDLQLITPIMSVPLTTFVRQAPVSSSEWTNSLGNTKLVLMVIYHLIALTGCHSPTLRPTAAEPSELLIQNYSFRSSELNRQVVLTLEFSFTDEGSRVEPLVVDCDTICFTIRPTFEVPTLLQRTADYNRWLLNNRLPNGPNTRCTARCTARWKGQVLNELKISAGCRAKWKPPGW